MVELLKKASKGLGLLVCTLMVGLAVSFVLPMNDASNGNTSVAQAAAKVNTKKITMSKGASAKIKVSGTKSKVTYSTSNKKIVTVSKKGVVKAVRKGKATIKVKVGKKTYKVSVKVEDPKISKTKITVKKGKTYQLKVSGTSRGVKWTSNNTSVATVDKKGKVTAKKSGQAVITAKINDKKVRCKVTVDGKNIIVCPDTITMRYGETKNITLTAGDGFDYYSENDSLVDVSINPSRFYVGDKLTMTLTGKAVGTTYIVFKSNNGWSKKCKVVVNGENIPTSVGKDYNYLCDTKVNYLHAYRSCDSKNPELIIESNITNNTDRKINKLWVCYSFYDRNGTFIVSYYDAINDPEKGKSYEKKIRVNNTNELNINDIGKVSINVVLAV